MRLANGGIRSITVAATVAALSGCVSTQQKNARTVLLGQRELAAESAVHVTRENPALRVTAVTVIRAGATSAFVVAVINTSTRPLSDLPVSVGLLGPRHRRIYLNGAANLDYYDTHIPSIGAGATVLWVCATGALPPHTGRPFAVVGTARLPRTTTVSTLPTIVAAARAGAGQLDVGLANRSGVPQYDLQVYAVATRRGHDVGAGRTTVADLEGGARTTVSLSLTGHTAGAAIQVYALPTIFS